MATEAFMPRLCLDIEDLLSSWEENGSGFSAFSAATVEDAVLDLTQVEASLHGRRPQAPGDKGLLQHSSTFTSKTQAPLQAAPCADSGKPTDLAWPAPLQQPAAPASGTPDSRGRGTTPFAPQQPPLPSPAPFPSTDLLNPWLAAGLPPPAVDMSCFPLRPPFNPQSLFNPLSALAAAMCFPHQLPPIQPGLTPNPYYPLEQVATSNCQQPLPGQLGVTVKTEPASSSVSTLGHLPTVNKQFSGPLSGSYMSGQMSAPYGMPPLQVPVPPNPYRDAGRPTSPAGSLGASGPLAQLPQPVAQVAQPELRKRASSGVLLHSTSGVTVSNNPDEYVRTRAEALDRYRQKRARRAYTKKIRYQLRKINADRRPRVKGRFVKKEEQHLYAHLLGGSGSTGGDCMSGAAAATAVDLLEVDSCHHDEFGRPVFDDVVSMAGDLDMDLSDLGVDDAWDL